MEVAKEVSVYEIHMQCDKCKQGEMRPTNMVYPAFPGQYEHQCDCCGYRTSYKKVYPSIEYREAPKKVAAEESITSGKKKAK